MGSIQDWTGALANYIKQQITVRLQKSKNDVEFPWKNIKVRFIGTNISVENYSKYEEKLQNGNEDLPFYSV